MQAKKTLGQNFLSNPAIAETILRAGEVKKGDNILEVGPGMGFLTDFLLKSGANVTAVEKDDRLISSLKAKFPSLTLIHGDILEYSHSGNYKIIANIPYYITGEFFRRFLQETAQPSLVIIMVQKEVAERIASEEKESILSLSVKIFGDPKYIETIKAENFDPVPKVDSAILAIYNIKKPRDIDLQRFFEIVHAGFAHKRKVLINNLEKIAPKEVLGKIWNELSLNPKIRAEDIHILTWKKIAQMLNS
ncbi:MAG: ribosomal RNA small subunit methyltransferase A [Candidatus Pacebacteria bacterium]|nr:ribosomal RNA small subunit methyltransferase A [Candidatus Paceibacterota bacterium]